MAPEPVPRIRLAAIPDDAVLVVRGDELDPDVLRLDAERFRRRFEQWGRFGVSALRIMKISLTGKRFSHFWMGRA